MFEFLSTPLVGETITLIVAGLIAWLPNRKKNNLESKQTIVDLYQESLTDLKQRYEEKFQDLKTGYDEKYEALRMLVNDLKNELADWKEKYFNLKRDFDNYKKKHP